MKPVKHEQICDSECRENLIGKIDRCVTVGGVLKVFGTFSAILLFLVALSINTYQSSQTYQNDEIKLIKQQIQENSILISEIRKDMQYIKEIQTLIHKNQQNSYDTIIKSYKK